MTIHRSRYCHVCRAMRDFKVHTQAGFARWFECLACKSRTRATDRRKRYGAGV